jgi:CheY-like chemotaxis protein
MLLVEVSGDHTWNCTLLTPPQDNPVNMMLLATYMKKNKWDFEKAENGLLALQAFQRRPEGFDVIFMGMPPSSFPNLTDI